MKKFIAIISTLIISFASIPTYANAVEESNITSVNITVEDNPELWERFLKYDLCILDYDSLTNEQKDLCKFIFETELNSEDTITCRRARRIIAGYDVGERVTLDTVEQNPAILDKTFYCYSNGICWSDYVDAVPDIVYLDYNRNDIEYWINDSGTEKIIETEINNGDTYYKHEIYEDDICISSDIVAKKCLKETEIISDGIFSYRVYMDDTLFVYGVKDRTSKYYEVPEEFNGMKVVGISRNAFKDCNKCIEIKLPETLEYIEGYAFENCSYLRNINIPNNVKAIGDRIFESCSDLKDVSIDCPNAMVSMYALEYSYINNAYLNFKTVESKFMRYGRNITLGDDVVKIGSTFVYSEAIDASEIIIPETVKVVINDYFSKRGNDSMMSNDISVPKNIEIFGAYQYSSIGKENNPMNSDIEPAYIGVLEEWYLSPDTIISGYYGTEAHDYALSHNLKFNPLDDLTYGDANNDGSINIADAVSLQNYLFGNDSVGYEADTNRDGKIDIFDMVILRKQIIENNK